MTLVGFDLDRTFNRFNHVSFPSFLKNPIFQKNKLKCLKAWFEVTRVNSGGLVAPLH